MQQFNLWGSGFEIQTTPTTIKKVKSKIDAKSFDVTPDKVLKSDKISIQDKLALISKEVYRILGVYKDNTLVIRDYDMLVDYIDHAIKNNIIAIDTETNNSLDYLTCKLMGPCIYTPDMKQAYIPVNHTDFDGILLPNQITEKQIKEQFDRLLPANVLEIYHNGKFDYQVLKCTTGFQAKIYWDTLIGARMLNENERAGLKGQYIDKIDSTIEKYDIESLFEGIEYKYVPPELFALYAATDSFMTYKLYDYQKKQFEKPENKSVYNCFMNVEMPCVEVIAEMELTGVGIDRDYSSRLSEYYHKQYDELQVKLNNSLQEFIPKIEEWRLTEEAQYHPRQYYDSSKDKDISKFPFLDEKGQYYKEKKSKSEQLDNPITTDSLNSPTQLSIILYDVLNVPEGIGDAPLDKSKPNYKPSRSTGEDALVAIDKQYNIPLLKQILENRGILKLINTYIDKIPEVTSIVDDRVHTHFNQIGADTGRTSSSDPINLQNIPSHNHLIRSMFKAKDGYTLIGSDFSGQEPRLLAYYSKDDAMYDTYLSGKDIYSQIATIVYNLPYEDCTEFKNGVLNVDGKERRSNCKPIILGIMYGRGIASIAEVLGCTKEKAQEILDTFFKGFPNVRKWLDDTYEFAQKHGYVEDYSGRRRRLPDILLPKFSIEEQGKNKKSVDNPLLFCKGIVQAETNPKIKEYETLLNNAKGKKDIDNIKSKAKFDKLIIHDNGGYIAKATRQCVNARIQGGAATLTKLAMIKIYNDDFMKERDAKLLINVHDELLMECPIEYAQECADRLAYDMCQAAVDFGIDIPMKCDADSFRWWYQDQIIGDIKKAIKGDEKKNKPPRTYEDVITNDYPFLLDEMLGDWSIC